MANDIVERLAAGAAEWDIAVADEIRMFGEGTEDAVGMADRAVMYREAISEIGRLREALSSETDRAEKAERERDAAYSVLTLAWKSIGRFPGSVYDRLMSRIERLLKGRNFDYTDPDLTAANATIADLTRKLEAAVGALAPLAGMCGFYTGRADSDVVYIQLHALRRAREAHAALSPEPSALKKEAGHD